MQIKYVFMLCDEIPTLFSNVEFTTFLSRYISISQIVVFIRPTFSFSLMLGVHFWLILNDTEAHL